jgi:hypothetical protein
MECNAVPTAGTVGVLQLERQTSHREFIETHRVCGSELLGHESIRYRRRSTFHHAERTSMPRA